MPWDITENFEYVVEVQEQAAICFGTSLARDCLSSELKYQSPFMVRLTPHAAPALGPGTYHDQRTAFDDVTNRIVSKRGLGPKSPRWAPLAVAGPPPELPPKPDKPKQNCAPFNQTARRKPLFTVADYPSACDYLPDYKKREVDFAYCFSAKKILRCPVMIKCVPYNLDACGVCHCSCSAQGDYWQFEDRLFLCRKHYDMLSKNCLSKFQGVTLINFKSVRDCFFMHSHNSCKAALKIMKKEEIVKKLRKEAYLNLFFPLRRLCAN